MKKIFLGMMMAAAFAAVAADAPKDPAAPYDDYGPAMASEKDNPMAVEWHNQNAAKLEEAVKGDALAAFVKDDASAKALLAQVQDAYKTDPLVAIQVAAVTQWTMEIPDPCPLLFWKESRKAERKVWVKALVETAETAKSDYVKLFMLDQLRWCGCKCPCLAARVRKVGAGSSKAVAEMSDLVARGLEAE